MKKVKIAPSIMGDTRTASGDVTPDLIRQASHDHINDVKSVFMELSSMMISMGSNHDWTKVTGIHEEQFHQDFMDSINNDTDFTKSKWYNDHIEREKHHPGSKLHDDMTFFDLIETIVDCTCAAAARSGGDPYFPDIPSESLKQIYENTQSFIKSMVEPVPELIEETLPLASVKTIGELTEMLLWAHTLTDIILHDFPEYDVGINVELKQKWTHHTITVSKNREWIFKIDDLGDFTGGMEIWSRVGGYEHVYHHSKLDETMSANDEEFWKFINCMQNSILEFKIKTHDTYRKYKYQYPAPGSTISEDGGGSDVV